MKAVEILLKNEVKKLEKILESARKRLRDVPEGNIRIDNRDKRVCVYYKNTKSKKEGDKNLKNGKYIKKENIGLAKKIIQRDYDQTIVRNGEERIKAINMFLRKYESTNIEEIYAKINKGRKQLLEYAILSDEEYVTRWEAVEYNGKPILDESKVIYTNKGEQVRSKSEKIIADRLNVLEIPYRYEYPLHLKDNVTIYPDFTILNIDTREEIYLEHCGLMDDQGYVETLMHKLKTYERNGIYLGVNLFITYETTRFPFNTKTLDELIKYLFSCTNPISLVK